MRPIFGDRNRRKKTLELGTLRCKSIARALRFQQQGKEAEVANALHRFQRARRPDFTGFGLKPSHRAEQSSVERTADSGTDLCNVKVDHCCAEVLVAEKLLHCADIVALFEQTSGERVAECVAASLFHGARSCDSFAYVALQG